MSLEYVYPTDRLLTGGSYSNEELFARMHATSDLAGVWSAADDQHYCGKWEVQLYVDDEVAQPVTTHLYAGFQCTEFAARGVQMHKTFVVPQNDDYRRLIYLDLDIRNTTAEERRLVITGDISYPEQAWLQFTKPPDLYQKLKRVVSTARDGLIVSKTVGREQEVRVLSPGVPLAHQILDDKGVQYVTEPMVLGPAERRVIWFAMVFSNQGEELALPHVHLNGEAATALERTASWWEDFARQTRITTPSPLLNRGLAWCKVNMGRQRVRYPSGWGFTNDPPQDVLVVRDAAWFVLGSDYLMPDFSMGILDLLARTAVEPGGKLTEYVLTCETPPYCYDYGLNVNDNTPLYVIAVWHHFLVTGNEEFIRSVYQTAVNAGEYLLTQRLGESGLIYCTSEEANVWGIAGWRNIIPGYQQNGAVTEINAEACYAFRCLGEMATLLGNEAQGRRWQAEADLLRERINRWLVSPDTGLYLVNIDTAGKRHQELTGDMVFPVMLGVADEGLARRTLQALYEPEFWTPFGVRTVGKNQPGYDPEYGMRLTGGIWPNLTAWVAYASRELYPERMVEAMENIYRICEVPVPREYRNVVPGQFPECLHGENFESRGMSLSPWMPATYLWVALEGILGLTLTPGGPQVNPHLPPHWHWLGVRSMPWRGGQASMFVVEGKVHSTIPVTSNLPVELFEEDVTGQFAAADQEDIIALRRGSELVVFIAAPEDRQLDLRVPLEIIGREHRLHLGLEAGNYMLMRL